jgi:hypothetical protein
MAAKWFNSLDTNSTPLSYMIYSALFMPPFCVGGAVFKGQIVSKFDLGLLNAYNPMYFDKNISENKELFVLCNERWILF